jgi:hypothetical protein
VSKASVQVGIGIGLVALASGFGMIRTTESAEAARQLCRNTYGGDVVSARNMRCSRARRIVRTWARRYKRDGRVNRIVLGFRCRDRSNQYEGLVVHCRRAPRAVRFYANVP